MIGRAAFAALIMAALPTCSTLGDRQELAQAEFSEEPTADQPDLMPAAPSATHSITPEIYGFSPNYRKVDLSFSPIPIDTSFPTVAGQLEFIQKDNCEETQDCFFRDRQGVLHYFWAEYDEIPLVIKLVVASDFTDRPIAALGIGMARQKDEVLSNVRTFLPGIVLDCDPDHVTHNVGPDECSAAIEPGWFRIGFDKQSRLQAVRFDAYPI